MTDRQLAAQLLTVFLARERDPGNYPSVAANELDSLYQEQIDWDPKGRTANRFLIVLDLTAQVFERLKDLGPRKKKFRRLEVMTIMMYLQDIARSPCAKVNRQFTDAVARTFDAQPFHERPSKGGTSGKSLQEYYDWWRGRSPDQESIHLDSRRTFNDEQKSEIWQRAGGKCEFPGCGEPVEEGDYEYDHFPIPYRDGGPTEVSNGRLVHIDCHPRGRPMEEE